MATFDLPALPEPPVSPHFLLGAASPLWGFYGAAAAGGVTYWLMTRWAQPMNLEALFGAAAKAPEAVVAAAEATVEVVEAPLEALPMVGGEAAPVGPLVEALAPEPVAEAVTPMETALQDVIEATAEPAVEAPPEPVAEVAPEPVVEVAAETPFVAAAEMIDAEPVVDAEPAPKARGRKASPGADVQA